MSRSNHPSRHVIMIGYFSVQLCFAFEGLLANVTNGLLVVMKPFALRGDYFIGFSKSLFSFLHNFVIVVHFIEKNLHGIFAAVGFLKKYVILRIYKADGITTGSVIVQNHVGADVAIAAMRLFLALYTLLRLFLFFCHRF